MPAIVGIIWKDHAPEAAKLQPMIHCLLHEPSYSFGTLAMEDMRVSLGWVSHRESFSDCMPVWNEARNIGLIFQGEDFTDHCEIQALKGKGHTFDAADASYLVHLYEEEGPRFVERLNGWFSGVVVDCRTRQILLFNDRYGLNRVYYHETPEGFYFSSEAKSLLKVLPCTRELDLQAFGEMLSCGCPLSDRALFRGISVLPKASLWTFRQNGTTDRAVYFRAEAWENQTRLNAIDYHQQLAATFSRILPRYFRGNRRIGMSLTGGVDSRMIMACAKPDPQSLPCYTFGGTYRESTDVQMARHVAKICRQGHETISVDTAFFQEFPALAEKTVFASDGLMDVSGSVELYVNRLAKEIAPVRLTGNYGGEILRRLVAFKPLIVDSDIFDPQVQLSANEARTTYTRELEGRRLSFVAFKQVPWHHYARFAIEQSQLTMRSPFLDNELVSLAYRAPDSHAADKQLSLHVIAEGNRALAEIETDRGLAWGRSRLVSNLHHSWKQFTFKAEYAFDYGMPQWLARLDYLFAPAHMETLFLGRHKFHHFRVWYRDRFADYIQSVLLDNRTLARPFLNRRRVEQIVRAHVRGTANHTLAIHKLLTCELIHRVLLEQH